MVFPLANRGSLREVFQQAKYPEPSNSLNEPAETRQSDEQALPLSSSTRGLPSRGSVSERSADPCAWRSGVSGAGLREIGWLSCPTLGSWTFGIRVSDDSAPVDARELPSTTTVDELIAAFLRESVKYSTRLRAGDEHRR